MRRHSSDAKHYVDKYFLPDECRRIKPIRYHDHRIDLFNMDRL